MDGREANPTFTNFILLHILKNNGGLTAPIITKTMTFTITNITMSHRTFGGYFIKGIVNGVTITATTEDSEAFDWWNDDSEIELHKQARLHCEWKLEEQFLSL